MPLTETAYAKINLALHVRRRREDGYHEIETLFAFVDDGDLLSVEVAERDSLNITGEFAEGLSAGPDNLVLRAVALARELGVDLPPLAIVLEKNLPVAAGLGGGSADAGAMLRLIAREWLVAPLPAREGLGVGRERSELPQALFESSGAQTRAPTPSPSLAGRGVDSAHPMIDALANGSAALGADVPACVLSQTMIGTGTGEILRPIADSDVSGMPVLLVNPNVPLPTGPVFKGWDGEDRGPLSEGGVLAATRAGRNDLQAPAMAICPAIDDVMTVLRAQLPLVARMSGSGATCFALFDSDAAMESAANRIWDDHPDWWLMAGHLR